MSPATDVLESSCVVETRPVESCYPAVYIRDLVKRYGKEAPTLKNLNMTVNKGTIYGLLGCSGSGKTTILSCIVGLQNWDSGDLWVLGHRPGKHLATKLGYMPQDTALYDQLCINEIVQFYGKLYKLSGEQFTKQWVLLKSLLQFPVEKILVGDMSGRERKRASLALALIHSPEILLLDEPTAGLDPVLREKIWNYLRKLVQTTNTTVILTTHYVEEARCSDMVGLMRNGRLVVECSPTNLLNKYNCQLLRDAVKALCQETERELKNQRSCLRNGDWSRGTSASQMHERNNMLLRFKKDTEFDSDVVTEKSHGYMHDTVSKIVGTGSNCYDIFHSFQKICGFTMVMSLTLIRHPVFLAMLLVMPTIQCCLALAALGYRVENLHFGVVNLDLKNWETECELQNLNTSTCTPATVSCGFTNEIRKDNMLILEDYESDEIALQRVQMGYTWGYFSIPENYSTHIINLAAQKQFASNETLDGSRILLHIDHSQYLTAVFIIKHLYNAYKNYTENLAISCGMSKGEFELPLEFRKPVHGDYSDNYTVFMFPGGVIMGLEVMTFVLVGFVFASDYKQSTLSRARVAGLNIADIIISNLAVQSVITLIQTGVLTAALYLLFGFKIKCIESQLLYLMLCFLTGLMATALGMVLGIACRDEVAIVISGTLMLIVIIMWGGVLLPTECTTWFWQQVGYIVPLKVPISALRSVLVRGVGITHPFVWSGFVAAFIWLAIYIGISVALFKALRL